MICLKLLCPLFLLVLAMMSSCKILTVTEILKAIREAQQEDDVIEAIRKAPEKMVNFIDDDPLGGKSLLMYAAAYNRLPIAQFLLDCGADVNQRSNFYGRPMNTPLIYAASWGHLDMVRLLLTSGASLDVQGSMASTALMFAAVNGHADVVQALLEAGAKTDLQDTKGQTAVALASWYGHSDVVKLLVEAGADLNIQRHMRYSGSTPLMKAQGVNDLGIVSTLTQAGANLDIQDAYGYTVTHYMAKTNDEAGLEIVLPYCPNLSLKEHELNATAADLALANGYISTAQLLLGHSNTSCLLHRPMSSKDLSGMTNVVETFDAYTDRDFKVTESEERVSTPETRHEKVDARLLEITTSLVNISRDGLERTSQNKIEDANHEVAELQDYSSKALDSDFVEDISTKPVLSDPPHELHLDGQVITYTEEPEPSAISRNDSKEADLENLNSEPAALVSTDNETNSQVFVKPELGQSQPVPLIMKDKSLTAPDIVEENVSAAQQETEILSVSEHDKKDSHTLKTDTVTSIQQDSDNEGVDFLEDRSSQLKTLNSIDLPEEQPGKQKSSQVKQESSPTRLQDDSSSMKSDQVELGEIISNDGFLETVDKETNSLESVNKALSKQGLNKQNKGKSEINDSEVLDIVPESNMLIGDVPEKQQDEQKSSLIRESYLTRQQDESSSIISDQGELGRQVSQDEYFELPDEKIDISELSSESLSKQESDKQYSEDSDINHLEMVNLVSESSNLPVFLPEKQPKEEESFLMRQQDDSFYVTKSDQDKLEIQFNDGNSGIVDEDMGSSESANQALSKQDSGKQYTEELDINDLELLDPVSESSNLPEHMSEKQLEKQELSLTTQQGDSSCIGLDLRVLGEKVDDDGQLEIVEKIDILHTVDDALSKQDLDKQYPNKSNISDSEMYPASESSKLLGYLPEKEPKEEASSLRKQDADSFPSRSDQSKLEKQDGNDENLGIADEKISSSEPVNVALFRQNSDKQYSGELEISGVEMSASSESRNLLDNLPEKQSKEQALSLTTQQDDSSYTELDVGVLRENADNDGYLEMVEKIVISHTANKAPSKQDQEKQYTDKSKISDFEMLDSVSESSNSPMHLPEKQQDDSFSIKFYQGDIEGQIGNDENLEIADEKIGCSELVSETLSNQDSDKKDLEELEISDLEVLDPSESSSLLMYLPEKQQEEQELSLERQQKDSSSIELVQGQLEEQIDNVGYFDTDKTIVISHKVSEDLAKDINKQYPDKSKIRDSEILDLPVYLLAKQPEEQELSLTRQQGSSSYTKLESSELEKEAEIDEKIDISVTLNEVVSEISDLEVLSQSEQSNNVPIPASSETAYDEVVTHDPEFMTTNFKNTREINENKYPSDISDLQHGDQTLLKPDTDELHPYTEQNSNDLFQEKGSLLQEMESSSVETKPPCLQNSDEVEREAGSGSFVLMEMRGSKRELETSDSVITSSSQKATTSEQKLVELESSDVLELVKSLNPNERETNDPESTYSIIKEINEYHDVSVSLPNVITLYDTPVLSKKSEIGPGFLESKALDETSIPVTLQAAFSEDQTLMQSENSEAEIKPIEKEILNDEMVQESDLDKNLIGLESSQLLPSSDQDDEGEENERKNEQSKVVTQVLYDEEQLDRHKMVQIDFSNTEIFGQETSNSQESTSLQSGESMPNNEMVSDKNLHELPSLDPKIVYENNHEVTEPSFIKEKRRWERQDFEKQHMDEPESSMGQSNLDTESELIQSRQSDLKHPELDSLNITFSEEKAEGEENEIIALNIKTLASEESSVLQHTNYSEFSSLKFPVKFPVNQNVTISTELSAHNVTHFLEESNQIDEEELTITESDEVEISKLKPSDITLLPLDHENLGAYDNDSKSVPELPKSQNESEAFDSQGFPEQVPSESEYSSSYFEESEGNEISKSPELPVHESTSNKYNENFETEYQNFYDVSLGNEGLQNIESTTSEVRKNDLNDSEDFQLDFVVDQTIPGTKSIELFQVKQDVPNDQLEEKFRSAQEISTIAAESEVSLLQKSSVQDPPKLESFDLDVLQENADTQEQTETDSIYETTSNENIENSDKNSLKSSEFKNVHSLIPSKLDSHLTGSSQNQFVLKLDLDSQTFSEKELKEKENKPSNNDLSPQQRSDEKAFTETKTSDTLHMQTTETCQKDSGSHSSLQLDLHEHFTEELSLSNLETDVQESKILEKTQTKFKSSVKLTEESKIVQDQSSGKKMLTSNNMFDQDPPALQESDVNSVDSNVTDDTGSDEAHTESDLLSDHFESESDLEIEPSLELNRPNGGDITETQFDSLASESPVKTLTEEEPSIDSSSKPILQIEKFPTSETNVKIHSNLQEQYSGEDRSSEMHLDSLTPIGNDMKESQELRSKVILGINSDNVNVEGKDKEGKSKEEKLLEENTSEASSTHVASDVDNFQEFQHIKDQPELREIYHGMAGTDFNKEYSLKSVEVEEKYSLELAEKPSEGIHILPFGHENEISSYLELREHEKIITKTEKLNEDISLSKISDTSLSKVTASDSRRLPDSKPNGVENFEVEAIASTGGIDVIVGEIQLQSNLLDSKQDYDNKDIPILESNITTSQELKAPDLLRSDFEDTQPSDSLSKDAFSQALLPIGKLVSVNSGENDTPSEVYEATLHEEELIIQDTYSENSSSFTKDSDELHIGGAIKLHSEVDDSHFSETSPLKQTELGSDKVYLIDSNPIGHETTLSLTNNSGLNISSENIQTENSTTLASEEKPLMMSEIKDLETQTSVPEAKMSKVSESKADGIGFVRKIASDFTNLFNELNKKKVTKDIPTRAVSDAFVSGKPELTSIDDQDLDTNSSKVRSKILSDVNEKIDKKISMDNEGNFSDLSLTNSDEIQANFRRKEMENLSEIITHYEKSQTGKSFEMKCQESFEIKEIQSPETNNLLQMKIDSDHVYSENVSEFQLASAFVDAATKPQISTMNIEPETDSSNEPFSSLQDTSITQGHEMRLAEDQDYKQRIDNDVPSLEKVVQSESNESGFVKRIAAGFNLQLSKPLEKKRTDDKTVKSLYKATEFGTPEFKVPSNHNLGVENLASKMENYVRHHESNSIVYDNSKSDTSKSGETGLIESNTDLEDSDLLDNLDEAHSQIGINEAKHVHVSVAETTENKNLLENESAVVVNSDNLDSPIICRKDSLCIKELCASYREETFANQIFVCALHQNEDSTLCSLTSENLIVDTAENDYSSINQDFPLEKDSKFLDKSHCSEESVPSENCQKASETIYGDESTESAVKEMSLLDAGNIPNIDPNEISESSSRHEHCVKEISIDKQTLDCDEKGNIDMTDAYDISIKDAQEDMGVFPISPGNVNGSRLDDTDRVENISSRDNVDIEMHLEVNGDELTESAVKEMSLLDAGNIPNIDPNEISESSSRHEHCVKEISIDKQTLDCVEKGNIDMTDTYDISIKDAQGDMGVFPISPGNVNGSRLDDTDRVENISSRDNVDIEMHLEVNEDVLSSEITESESTGTDLYTESVEIGTDIYNTEEVIYRTDNNAQNACEVGAAEADLLDLEDIEVATVFANALELDVIEGDRVEVMSIEVPEGDVEQETIDVSAMFADVVEVENITSGTPDTDILGSRTPDLGRIETRFIDKVFYKKYIAKNLQNDGICTPTDTLDIESVDDTDIIFASEAHVVNEFEESVGIDAVEEERASMDSRNSPNLFPFAKDFDAIETVEERIGIESRSSDYITIAGKNSNDINVVVGEIDIVSRSSDDPTILVENSDVVDAAEEESIMFESVNSDKLSEFKESLDSVDDTNINFANEIHIVNDFEESLGIDAIEEEKDSMGSRNAPDLLHISIASDAIDTVEEERVGISSDYVTNIEKKFNEFIAVVGEIDIESRIFDDSTFHVENSDVVGAAEEDRIILESVDSDELTEFKENSESVDDTDIIFANEVNDFEESVGTDAIEDEKNSMDSRNFPDLVNVSKASDTIDAVEEERVKIESKSSDYVTDISKNSNEINSVVGEIDTESRSYDDSTFLVENFDVVGAAKEESIILEPVVGDELTEFKENSDSVDDTDIIFANEIHVVDDFEESIGIDAIEKERFSLESRNLPDLLHLSKKSDVLGAAEGERTGIESRNSDHVKNTTKSFNEISLLVDETDITSRNSDDTAILVKNTNVGNAVEEGRLILESVSDDKLHEFKESLDNIDDTDITFANEVHVVNDFEESIGIDAVEEEKITLDLRNSPHLVHLSQNSDVVDAVEGERSSLELRSSDVTNIAKNFKEFSVVANEMDILSKSFDDPAILVKNADIDIAVEEERIILESVSTDKSTDDSTDDTNIIFADEVHAVNDFEESIGIDAVEEEKVNMESRNFPDLVHISKDFDVTDAVEGESTSLVSISSDYVISIAKKFNEISAEVDEVDVVSRSSDDPTVLVKNSDVSREIEEKRTVLRSESSENITEFEESSDAIITLDTISAVSETNFSKESQDISLMEEAAFDVRDDITNSVEIAAEEVMPRSENLADGQSCFFSDDFENIPIARERTGSVSSTCSSVGKDIEDLIIAISKTAYIGVASDVTDQTDPVTEAVETNEMSFADDPHSKIGSASATSSITSQQKIDTKSVSSPMELSSSSDDFTLTDISNTGTEIDTEEIYSITSTEDEFEASNNMNINIHRFKPLHPSDIADEAKAEPKLSNEPGDIIYKADSIKEARPMMNTITVDVESVESLSSSFTNLSGVETEDAISLDDSDPVKHLGSLGSGRNNDNYVSHRTQESNTKGMSTTWPSEDINMDQGNGLSQSPPDFSVINITEAVIIADSADNSETLIGTVKYSLMKDDNARNSPNSEPDISYQATLDSIDESAQETTTGRFGINNKYFEDIPLESRTPTPTGTSKYSNIEISRTPTPTGIRKYFDALTKASRTPTPTGFRKYFSSFTRESRTPTPTKSIPVIDMEVEQVNTDTHKNSDMQRIDKAIAIEVGASAELTEVFDLEAVVEAEEPGLAEAYAPHEADDAIDIAEIIIDSQISEVRESIESSRAIDIPVKYADTDMTDQNFDTLSSVSKVVTAELVSAARQVGKAESLLTLATSQLTDVLTTVRDNDKKQHSSYSSP